MEKVYRDTLKIFPDHILIELTFVRTNMGDFMSDMPIKIFTEEEVKSKLQKYDNLRLTLKKSQTIKDSFEIYLKKYELKVDQYSTYQEIAKEILKSTIYKIKDFKMSNLNAIEKKFISNMDSNVKSKYVKEFNLTIQEMDKIKIEEFTNTYKEIKSNTKKGFGALKEPLIENRIGKYLILKDGTFGWERAVRVLTKK